MCVYVCVCVCVCIYIHNTRPFGVVAPLPVLIVCRPFGFAALSPAQRKLFPASTLPNKLATKASNSIPAYQKNLTLYFVSFAIIN